MSISVPPMRDYYRIGLRANFLALAGILIMNIATPVDFSARRISELTEDHWFWVLLFRGVLLALVTVVTTLPYMLAVKQVMAPVQKCSQKAPVPEDLLAKARKRILNLPFTIVPINMALWIFTPILVMAMFFLMDMMSLPTAAAFSLRATMVGMFSSALIFFQLEHHARHTLVPVFFPEGQLTRVKGAVQLSIRRRIRAFYRMGTLIPLAHIVLTLLALLLQVDAALVDAKTFARSVFLFSVITFFLFLLGSGILVRMMTRSIIEPVNEMLSAVGRVGRGDYTARVQVVANDEIGVLGDAFNRTIQGLEEREVLRDTFGRYVAPEIRDEILSGRIPLDGEYKEVTVMFADLRDFTPLTASRDPKEVVRLLKAYFEAMAGALKANNGLILQFLGDEIYAVFGAPVPRPSHARDAVKAALDMDAALAGLNRRLKADGLPNLAHGIGIHTGQVVAANIGSPDRLSYLLVGDTVNLASRLQGLTRELGAGLVVSEATAGRLGDWGKKIGLDLHPVPVTVKGMDQALKVFVKSPCPGYPG